MKIRQRNCDVRLTTTVMQRRMSLLYRVNVHWPFDLWEIGRVCVIICVGLCAFVSHTRFNCVNNSFFCQWHLSEKVQSGKVQTSEVRLETGLITSALYL